MTIKLLVFANLQEELGVSEESLDFIEGESVRSAFIRLQRKHGRSLNNDFVRVAINEVFSSWDDLLQDEDEVAFITPVSGG